jgi:hypothetical protein
MIQTRTQLAAHIDKCPAMSRNVSSPCHTSTRRRLGILSLLTLSLCGCISFGPSRLRHDQVDYARALADARKHQTLSSIVGLRFADTPAFLTTSQVIAGYTFTASGTGTLTSILHNTTLAVTPTATNTPTFTFSPLTGEAYADAYIRPLPPSLILPLAQGGAPIDVVLRLAAQSIGPLQNSGTLGGIQSNGNPDFYGCLFALRQLQIAGAMDIQFSSDKQGNHVFLQLAPDESSDRALANGYADTVRRLLKLKPNQNRFEIIYGQGSASGEQVPVLTRSVLSILDSIGAQVDVPAQAINSHATMPTVRFSGIETRPVVIIHSGSKAPDNAYVSTRYGNAYYWIEYNDFDSKYAFNVLQTIMALAESNNGKQTPIVTIPAG